MVTRKEISVWLLFCFFPLVAYSSGGTQSMLPSKQPTKLLCTIRGKSFLDNSEYFNKIMEGETIFGFHFLPSLTLAMAKGMGLNLGLIWEKHFGHIKPWANIRPALSICYNDQTTTFVIGIFSYHPPTLLEPLYVANKPYIEGFHFKLVKNKSHLSGWLNWLTLLSKKEHKPETFTFHLDGAYSPADANKKVSCTIPFQLAVYHLGGQGIAVKAYTLWCGAGGLALHWRGRFRIDGASYLLLNRYVKNTDRPFQKGWAQYHTIHWLMPFLGLSLSYWYGHHFSSENMGHRLYQSMRIEDYKTVYYEGIRSLLFLSIYKDWMPYSGVTIQALFRPYYDCKNRLLEYSFSCKLAYTLNIASTTLRHASG